MGFYITIEVKCDKCMYSEFVKAVDTLTPFLQKDGLKFEPYVNDLEDGGWSFDEDKVLCLKHNLEEKEEEV